MVEKSPSPDRRTFVDLCLNGEAFVDQLEDFVDAWHDEKSDQSLHEFLGFTFSEYKLLVEKANSIKFIFDARRRGRPLDDYRTMANSFRLAARAISQEDADDLIAWLKKTGRIDD